MSTRTHEGTDLADVKQYCFELAEGIGIHRWHGWSIPDDVIHDWEAILDGSLLESLGYGHLADEVAEIALNLRHDAYYNHSEADCRFHLQWRNVEDDLTLDFQVV